MSSRNSAFLIFAAIVLVLAGLFVGGDAGPGLLHNLLGTGDMPAGEQLPDEANIVGEARPFEQPQDFTAPQPEFAEPQSIEDEWYAGEDEGFEAPPAEFAPVDPIGFPPEPDHDPVPMFSDGEAQGEVFDDVNSTMDSRPEF